MAQVIMPNARPTQLDALAVALNIGSTLYGIKYKQEEMEQSAEKLAMEKSRRAEEKGISELTASKLHQDIQQSQKQALAQDRLSKGQFSSPLEAQSTLGQLGMQYSNRPLSNDDIKIDIGGQVAYASPKRDLKDQLTGLQIQKEKIELSHLPEKLKADLEKQKETILASQANRTKVLADAAKIVSENSGGKQLAPVEIDKHAEGAAIPSMMKDLKQSIIDNKSSFGPIVGLAKFNPYNEVPVTLQGQFKTAAQLIGKYMEGGVLRKEDEAKYEQMLPRLTDTPELAMNKLNLVNKMIVDRYNQNLMSLKKSGYNISGLPEYSSPQIPNVIRKNIVPIESAMADEKKPIFNPKKEFKEVK